MILDRRGFVAAGSAALLSGCATLSPRKGPDCTPLPMVNVDESRIIRTVAGLRPYRSSGFVVRREQLGDNALVHNYGHGGAGITLSWGSSRLAVDLGLAGHSGPVAVFERGETDPTPQPDDIARIVRSHRAFFGSLRCTA